MGEMFKVKVEFHLHVEDEAALREFAWQQQYADHSELLNIAEPQQLGEMPEPDLLQLVTAVVMRQVAGNRPPLPPVEHYPGARVVGAGGQVGIDPEREQSWHDMIRGTSLE